MFIKDSSQETFKLRGSTFYFKREAKIIRTEENHKLLKLRFITWSEAERKLGKWIY